jgi:hypothetical protein
MSLRAGLVCLLAVLSSSACVVQDADDGAAGEAALSTARSAVTYVEPISTTPLPIYSIYAESWNPRTSSPLVWPSDATRIQVIIRRGYAATLYTAATFYAFIVSDGSRVRRVLHVSNNDYGGFLTHLNAVYTAAETPNSERSHSIAGGTYVGPHPAGPPGDPISPTLISRVLTSAAAIDDAAQAAVNQEF